MNFDPLQAMTTSPETNEVFRALGGRLSALAETASCSIGLAHHLRKLGGREAEIEDSRGGIALIGAVRAARVLNPMTKDEARNAGLPTHIDHFRVDGAGIGKTNLTRPSERADWYRRVPSRCRTAIMSRWSNRGIGPTRSLGSPPPMLCGCSALSPPAPTAARELQANDWAGYVVANLGITASKAERAASRRCLRPG